MFSLQKIGHLTQPHNAASCAWTNSHTRIGDIIVEHVEYCAVICALKKGFILKAVVVIAHLLAVVVTKLRKAHEFVTVVLIDTTSYVYNIIRIWPE